MILGILKKDVLQIDSKNTQIFNAHMFEIKTYYHEILKKVYSDIQK